MNDFIGMIKKTSVFFIFFGMIGVFLCSLLGVSFLAHTLNTEPKPKSVFGVQQIPLEVRVEAQKDLQKNLLGAKLNKANRDAINYQIFEAGLYLDEDSVVQLYTDEEYARLKEARHLASLRSAKIMLHNAALEYKRGSESDGYGLLPLLALNQSVKDNNCTSEIKCSVNASSMNLNKASSEVIEEEEEEEFTRSTDIQFHIQARQNLLMRYILTQLDEGLRTAPRYKGKRVAGSEYLQEQLKKYNNK